MHLERVLERLKGEGLHLKPEKRKFDASQVDYLGHTLTAEGVKPNESKIVAVKEFPKPQSVIAEGVKPNESKIFAAKEFPKPQSVKEVQTFLGLVNFYRRHVRNMATICIPLTALTQKDRKEFLWSSDCDKAFDKIKHLLVTVPLLHPPNLEKKFFFVDRCQREGLWCCVRAGGNRQGTTPSGIC